MKRTHTTRIRRFLLFKRCIMLSLLAPCLLLVAYPTPAAVIYRVTFAGTWNDSDVMGAIPGSAHFTSLVGATHTNGQALWAPGGLATVGIEDVAEMGNSTALDAEISAAIMAGTAETAFTVDGLNNFPSASATTFEVSASHPYVTAISMIAPSPDWFVGVSNLSLMSGGNWIPDQTINLYPWDAGTEDGSLFSLSNPASNPHVPIAALADSPFIGLPAIGTLRFELVSVPVPGSGLLFLSGLVLLARRRTRSS